MCVFVQMLYPVSLYGTMTKNLHLVRINCHFEYQYSVCYVPSVDNENFLSVSIPYHDDQKTNKKRRLCSLQEAKASCVEDKKLCNVVKYKELEYPAILI